MSVHLSLMKKNTPPRTSARATRTAASPVSMGIVPRGTTAETRAKQSEANLNARWNRTRCGPGSLARFRGRTGGRVLSRHRPRRRTRGHHHPRVEERSQTSSRRRSCTRRRERDGRCPRPPARGRRTFSPIRCWAGASASITSSRSWGGDRWPGFTRRRHLDARAALCAEDHGPGARRANSRGFGNSSGPRRGPRRT